MLHINIDFAGREGVRQSDRPPRKTLVNIKTQNIASLDLIVVPTDTVILLI